MNRTRRLLPLAMLAAVIPSACTSSGDTHAPVTITLVAYDSFPTTGSGVNTALTEFTAQSGITVKIVTAGDAGTMVSKAALTAGTPEGDVMWGVDNTLLSAATDGKVFDGQPTEVDHGDVCVNYDIAWFAKHQLQPPASLDDLVKPEYKNLLVVEDASASSTGLAFLLGTIASKGDTWTDYWKALRANGVEVSDSWDTAYYQRFSGAAGSKGDKPLVVSYASSPPAEVVFANPPRTDAPTGVSTDTCFRQIEYAGVLRGTSHTDAAKQLVDFFRSDRFQRELPLSLFVNPVDPKTALPDAFVKYGVVPASPFTMNPATIAAHRTAWQEQWHQVVIA
jgi:thiamine transport system substrate-binding protein